MSDYIRREDVAMLIEDHKRVAYGCSKQTREISDMIHNQLVDLVKHMPSFVTMMDKDGDGE